ncbi:MAG: hypothetical protein AAB645_00335 [Patescibacteria group bacterium]
MITTTEVKRTGNESNANLLRRFSRRVQSSGVLRRAKRLRFASRRKSPLKKKNDALKKIIKRAATEKLRKLGKIKDVYYKKSH